MLILSDWLKFLKRSFPSFLYAFQAILGVLQLIDVFRVEYVLMTHRVTRYVNFKLPFDLVPILLVLFLAWGLISVLQRNFIVFLFPITSFLVYPFLGIEGTVSFASLFAVAGSLWSSRDVQSFLTWIFFILGAFEALALAHWLILLPLGFRMPFEAIAQFEMKLSHVVMNLGPFLVLILVFLSLLKPAFYLLKRKKELKPREYNITLVNPTFYLLVILFFSSFSAIYPYLQNINELGVDVGVDTVAYVPDVRAVEEDIFQIFKVQSGSRPFFYLFVFVVQKLLNLDALTVIRYLGVLLLPVMTLAVYFFSKEVFNNEAMAILASFFTVFGYPTSVGIYSNFLTNILGLCFTFSSIGFLFRAIRTSSKFDITISVLFMVLLLFTHPWTFSQYIMTLALTLAISPFLFRDDSLIFNKKGRLGVYIILFIFIVFLGLAELLKINIFRSYGILEVFSGAFSSMTSYTNFWRHLMLGIKFRFGGFLLNIVPLCLMIVGILVIRLYDIKNLFIVIFMFATSGVFLIMGVVIKSRLLYNVPVGILCSLGFLTIYNATKSVEMKRSFILFVTLSAATVLFRGLANLL